jgi:hypothetical protein
MLREPTIEKLHAMRSPVMALATGGWKGARARLLPMILY